jgi:hypothetical protein
VKYSFLIIPSRLFVLVGMFAFLQRNPVDCWPIVASQIGSHDYFRVADNSLGISPEP